jgi:hypothetical protein
VERKGFRPFRVHGLLIAFALDDGSRTSMSTHMIDHMPGSHIVYRQQAMMSAGGL